MSRLDQEYSAAEHHDLDRIVTDRVAPAPDQHTPICACGKVLDSEPTRTKAFAAWDLHQEQAVFG